MLEYIIIEAEGYDRLQNGVNQKIKEGFEPVGGISSPAKTGRASRNRRVAQALIREVEEEESTDFADLTVSKIKEHIQGVNDVDDLETLLDVESSNQDRKTAKSAIEDRIADLSEPETTDEPSQDDSGTVAEDSEYVEGSAEK